jgi:hypothetical protein
MKVAGYEHLERTADNSIINTDNTEYNNRLAVKKKRQQQEDRIERLEKLVAALLEREKE